MRVIGRLLVALAIAFPISMIVVGAAHGDSGEGPAVIKCMHWKDVVKISPGVGNDPSDQGVVGHGKLYGCNKAGGAAEFSGTFQITDATCSNLAMTGSGQLEWADGGHSTLFLSFEPQDVEPRKIFVTGTVTSGAFQGLIARAWLRFTPEFDGSGVNCGPQNLLKKLRFSNTQSFQLLTPNVPDTTEPPPDTTPDTPPTVPETVPQTNGGTTTEPQVTTQHTRPPITVVVFQPVCCRNVVIVHRTFPTGTLAFTGSSRLAAVIGFEALLVGGVLACMDPDRKKRGAARFSRRLRRPKKSLSVTLPPR
jgi:hypothetical protein